MPNSSSNREYCHYGRKSNIINSFNENAKRLADKEFNSQEEQMSEVEEQVDLLIAEKKYLDSDFREFESEPWKIGKQDAMTEKLLREKGWPLDPTLCEIIHQAEKAKAEENRKRQLTAFLENFQE